MRRDPAPGRPVGNDREAGPAPMPLHIWPLSPWPVLPGRMRPPVSVRRSAGPATRTDFNNNIVLARANRSRAWKRAVVLLSAAAAGACAAGCERMLLLLRARTRSKAKQGIHAAACHVRNLVALHAQDNGCRNAAVLWSLPTLLCSPFVNHTWLPFSGKGRNRFKPRQ